MEDLTPGAAASDVENGSTLAAVTPSPAFQDTPPVAINSTADRISRALVSLLHHMPPPTSTPESPPPSTPGLSDRPSLLQRVSTFKPTSWFGAPAGLDPLACACHGWVNVGRGLLSCQLCKEQVAMTLPAVGPGDGDKWDKAMNGLVSGLKSRHRAGCLWRRLECLRQVLAYSSESPSATTSAFSSRVQQLLQVDYLPDIDKAAVDSASQSHMPVVSSLTSTAPALAPPSPELSVDWKEVLASPAEQAQWRLNKQQKAVLLALFGWSVHVLPVDLQKLRKEMSTFGVGHLLGSAASLSAGDKSSSQQQQRHHCSQTALQCTECQARVGLWQFFGAAAAATPVTPLDALRLAATGCLPELLPDPLSYLTGINLSATPAAQPSTNTTNSESPVQTTPLQAAATGGSIAGSLRTAGSGRAGSLGGQGSSLSSAALNLTRARSQLRSTIAGGQYSSSAGVLEFADMLSPRDSPFGSKRREPVFGLAAMSSSKKQKVQTGEGDSKVGMVASGPPSPPCFSPPRPAAATPFAAAATSSDNGATAGNTAHRHGTIGTGTNGTWASVIEATSIGTMGNGANGIGTRSSVQASPSTPAVTLRAFNASNQATSTQFTGIQATGAGSGAALMTASDAGWLANSIPSVPRQRPSNGQLLDPVQSHRSWCPYVCGYGTGLPGWLCVVQAMSRMLEGSTNKGGQGDALERAKQCLQVVMRLPGEVDSVG